MPRFVNNLSQELVGTEIPEDGIIILQGDNHEDCEVGVVGGKVKESNERIDKTKESFLKDEKDDQDDGTRFNVTKHNLSQKLVGVEIPKDCNILLQGNSEEDCDSR